MGKNHASQYANFGSLQVNKFQKAPYLPNSIVPLHSYLSKRLQYKYKKVVYIPRHITTPKKQVFAHYAHHWYLHLMHHIKQYDSFHKFRL